MSQIVLNLDLGPIGRVSNLAAEAVILAGHNELHDFTGVEDILSYTIIGHHPDGETGKTFTGVRADYGVCSSIVAEYLHDVDAKPILPDIHASKVNAPYTAPSQVTVGLVYGILTDTRHPTAGYSAADFDTADFLFPGINEDHLDRTVSPEASREVLETRARVIAGRDVRSLFAVVDIDIVSGVDAVPQAIDKLIQLEGVTMAVVCGGHGSSVYLSDRSHDNRIHMGRILEVVPDRYRRSNVGGHTRMGGGRIVQPDAVTDGGNNESVPRDEPVEHISGAFSDDT